MLCLMALRRTAGVVEAGDEHATRDCRREKGRESSCQGKEKKKRLNLPQITICSIPKTPFSVFPAKKSPYPCHVHCRKKSILQPQPVHLPLKQLYRDDEVK